MPRRKRPAASKGKRPAKRARNRTAPRSPASDVFVPPGFVAAAPVLDPVNEEGDVYVPPSFGQPAAEDAPDSQGGGEWMRYLEEPAFFRGEIPLDVAIVREYVEELARAGFDERGTCRWKCGGAMSVIGRVRPPVALHNYACPYWDTPEGKTVTPF